MKFKRRGNNYISVNVDIDLNEHISEFLDCCDDSDLIAEIKNRNIFNQLTHPISLEINNLSGINLKNHLCDLLNTGYLIHDNDEIIEMIKQKLNNK